MKVVVRLAKSGVGLEVEGDHEMFCQQDQIFLSIFELKKPMTLKELLEGTLTRLLCVLPGNMSNTVGIHF